MGRPGRVPGTRELVIPRTSFIVPYRLVGNAIHVLRIFHAARTASRIDTEHDMTMSLGRGKDRRSLWRFST
jgi:plasmid stabilization system protein ParE